MKKLMSILVIVSLMIGSLVGCSTQNNQSKQPQDTAGKQEPRKIKVLLDWVPNTNHTGLYVAKDKGYYSEEGLDVEIIQPAEGGSADLIAAGQGEFGISYQEQVTYAKTADNPLPIKAIAAIIQHNTSGFASPVGKNIKTAKDFEGKRYGGWGSPVEEAMIKALMEKEGADFTKVKMVNVGAADFFTSTEKDVDFSWIYYGWDGVASNLKSKPINFIKLQDVEKNLDFYTPVIVAKDDTIKNDPELVKKFLRATSKGYNYSVENPEDAVNSLLKFASEIDKTLAVESQKYLAKEYIADAPRWGEMKQEIWGNYSNWLFEKGLITKKLDVKEAYTNDYLPEK
jgi:ABC-type nitrate/sulfonate/bicarbonate transport system substrate-binding protein